MSARRLLRKAPVRLKESRLSEESARTMDADGPPPAKPTVLATPTSTLVGSYVLLGAVGAGLGWLVRLLSGWAATVDGMPFRDWISIIASMKEPYATVGCVVVGAGAGAFCVRLVMRGSVALSVTGKRIIWKAGGKPRKFERAEVGAVFFDGDDLILLGPAGEELTRADSNMEHDVVAATMTKYGYPWSDADPYLDDYRRWVDDMPGLSLAVNALMKARQKALQENESDSAAELRADLAKLGVVIRETDDRQFYRLVGEQAEVPEPAQVADAAEVPVTAKGKEAAEVPVTAKRKEAAEVPAMAEGKEAAEVSATANVEDAAGSTAEAKEAAGLKDAAEVKDTATGAGAGKIEETRDGQGSDQEVEEGPVSASRKRA